MPHSASSPQTPIFSRSRRPSYTSDISPLHASMVGSYEESILRGRMSTTPSKPLDFVAQIGVLGFGKCKSSLRCPPHVTLPFPAVFYDYESTSHGRRGKAEDGPSPYVGCIDLENGLPSPEDARDTRKRRRNATLERIHNGDLDADGAVSEREIRRAEKQKRRSTSPRTPPGGSYRIPEKGQLQIIIKNPNKTAVKLFLVPYDLSGMEPGTKTFIRQRSYSAGPILETALSASPAAQGDSVGVGVGVGVGDRPTLSPARGRFYLYKSVRVVFANRVPDGKERLRNEISVPEPRFSVWKGGRDGGAGGAGGGGGIGGGGMGMGAALVAEKAFRRRSAGFMLGRGGGGDEFVGVGVGGNGGMEMGMGMGGGMVDSVAFNFPARSSAGGGGGGGANMSGNISSGISMSSNMRGGAGGPEPETEQSPTSSSSDRTARLGMGMGMGLGAGYDYDKLNRGDVGYGGKLFAASGMGGGSGSGSGVVEGMGRDGGTEGRTAAVPEGLLALKLRGLGMDMDVDVDGGEREREREGVRREA
ncbi:succinate dehydrogenase protein [Rutstroemia sp. NJR-2017a BBW]|nr:succinate dehydrogenase protein [Rutstroemia sp. NJR-2017a BBW]